VIVHSWGGKDPRVRRLRSVVALGDAATVAGLYDQLHRREEEVDQEAKLAVELVEGPAHRLAFAASIADEAADTEQRPSVGPGCHARGC